MKKLVLLLIVVLIVPVASIAAPTPEATREVLAHFFNGKSPVLVEIKLCSDIAREGANKNECVSEVNSAAIAKDQKVFVWMNFMVPQNTTPALSILFARNNRPENTINVDLKESLKYRTWTTIPTGKGGSYSIQIDQEVNDNFTTLKSLNYQVAE